MKILLKEAKKYWKEIVISIILTMISVVISLYLPKITAGLINEGIGNSNIEYIKSNGLKMVILSIFSIIVGTSLSFILPKIEIGIAYHLRLKIFNKINDLSLGNFNNLSAETILTRITNDVDNISMLASSSIRALQAPFLIIISFVLSVRINAKLAFMLLSILPIGLIVFLISSKFVKPIFKRLQDEKDKINNAIMENISGIRDVKTYQLEEKELKNFDIRNKALTKTNKKVVLVLNLLGPIASIIAIIISIIVLLTGADLIFKNKLTVGDLFAFTGYSAQILVGILIAFSFASTIITASASFERLKEILNAEPKVLNNENPIKEMNDNSIEFENVSFGYGEEGEILKNISFKISGGKSLGIIGKTGSGKSTIANLISRNYDPDSGVIKIGGIDIKKYDIEFLNDCISKVEQQSKIFAGTIKSNILIGNNNATDDEIHEYLKLAEASEFIDKYTNTINHRANQNGSNFSGGQKQRISIARAISKDSKIIIIDDATSALDFETERKIQKMIDTKLNNSLTKVIISQRINSIKHCDKIIVLDDGKIDGIGTHDDLIKSSKQYRKINEIQGGTINE